MYDVVSHGELLCKKAKLLYFFCWDKHWLPFVFCHLKLRHTTWCSPQRNTALRANRFCVLLALLVYGSGSKWYVKKTLHVHMYFLSHLSYSCMSTYLWIYVFSTYIFICTYRYIHIDIKIVLFQNISLLLLSTSARAKSHNILAHALYLREFHPDISHHLLSPSQVR